MLLPSRWPLGLSLAGALLLAGCGSGSIKHAVQGKITFEGKPVSFGSVMLLPEDDGPRITAVLEASGGYRLQAPAGRYRVGVAGRYELPISPERLNDRSPLGRPPLPETELLPARFAMPENSGVFLQVEARDLNELNLPLE